MVIGIGDDTAAWHGSDRVQLATTDSLVEEVHFSFRWSTWEDLGYKSLAVNLSDIAAMGGHALYALVSLSCPGDVDSDSILAFYRGMTSLAQEHGVVIIGGNLARSPFVTASVFVAGESATGRLLRRSAARPGDVIAVTGFLGAAAGALSLMAGDTDTSTRVPDTLMQALIRPHARLAEGRILAHAGVECAIDISDGLLSDLGHICECSRASATLRASLLPVSVDCRTACQDASTLALTGGEVYELLFTCRAETMERVTGMLQCPVTVIGEMGPGTDHPSIVVLGPDDLPIDVAVTGWSHFRQ